MSLTSSNRDKIRAQNKQWYLANKARVAERGKQYRAANSQSIRRKRAAYRSAHRQKLAAKQLARYYANKAEHQRKHAMRRAAKRQEHREWSRNRSAALTDSYVREQLSKYSTISSHEWPQEIVDAKKQALQIKRELKQQRSKTGSSSRPQQHRRFA
jgi:hypothetical protein